jgi:serine/threonine protein kinase
VKTLAVACHHVHIFGPIHRDLKPANVLFGEGDVPKIADFGLALAGELTGEFGPAVQAYREGLRVSDSQMPYYAQASERLRACERLGNLEGR